MYLKNHALHYLAIILLFSVTVYAIDSNIATIAKIVIILLAIIAYFFWAIWHHGEDHTLTKTTLLEYIAIAALILWLLFNVSV